MSEYRCQKGARFMPELASAFRPGCPQRQLRRMRLRAAGAVGGALRGAAAGRAGAVQLRFDLDPPGGELAAKSAGDAVDLGDTFTHRPPPDPELTGEFAA